MFNGALDSHNGPSGPRAAQSLCTYLLSLCCGWKTLGEALQIAVQSWIVVNSAAPTKIFKPPSAFKSAHQ